MTYTIETGTRIDRTHGKREVVLTNRRSAILAMVREHIAEHGYSPTLREIGDAVGLVSPSSVDHQLRQLAEAGYISFTTACPRSIVLLTGPCARCGCPGSHPDGES